MPENEIDQQPKETFFYSFVYKQHDLNYKRDVQTPNTSPETRLRAIHDIASISRYMSKEVMKERAVHYAVLWF